MISVTIGLVLRQRAALQRQYPGVVVLFKETDGLYRAYAEDARMVAGLLGIDPGYRPGPHGEAVAVLAHDGAEIDALVTRLLAAGRRVILAARSEDGDA